MLGRRSAARRGGVYFVTDGEPVVFRDFVTRLLATQGVTRRRARCRRRSPRAVAAAGETRVARCCRCPATPAADAPGRLGVRRWRRTIDITRARTELGYAPVRTIDAGLGGAEQP